MAELRWDPSIGPGDGPSRARASPIVSVAHDRSLAARRGIDALAALVDLECNRRHSRLDLIDRSADTHSDVPDDTGAEAIG
jgi:hypothetical protein